MNFEEFKYSLKEYVTSSLVFVGLGNELRNDDAAGLLFLRELHTSIFKEAFFIEAERTPENYLEIILRYNPQAVIFIDASDWGGKPGEIKWLQFEEPAGIKFSTHTYSIKLIEHYLSAFKEMDFFYLGIQVQNVNDGCSISPDVKHGLKEFFLVTAA